MATLFHMEQTVAHVLINRNTHTACIVCASCTLKCPDCPARTVRGMKDMHIPISMVHSALAINDIQHVLIYGEIPGWLNRDTESIVERLVNHTCIDGTRKSWDSIESINCCISGLQTQSFTIPLIASYFRTSIHIPIPCRIEDYKEFITEGYELPSMYMQILHCAILAVGRDAARRNKVIIPARAGMSTEAVRESLSNNFCGLDLDSIEDVPERADIMDEFELLV